jgi:hypothetical protein
LNSVALDRAITGWRIIAEALRTIERALKSNPDELACRPRDSEIARELPKPISTKLLKLAKKIRAKSWELRATMSFGAIARRDDSPEMARAMLAEIYPSFTEGFDTADLKEAQGAAR